MGLNKLFMLITTLALLIGPIPAVAEELVSGRYISSSGKEITVELKIGSPAPSSVIVVQNLPRGIQVISSSPRLKMYDPAKGNAKWLLSKVSSGKMKVSMTIDRAINKGDVSGEVRCRNKVGKMVSVALTY